VRVCVWREGGGRLMVGWLEGGWRVVGGRREGSGRAAGGRGSRGTIDCRVPRGESIFRRDAPRSTAPLLLPPPPPPPPPHPPPLHPAPYDSSLSKHSAQAHLARHLFARGEEEKAGARRDSGLEKRATPKRILTGPVCACVRECYARIRPRLPSLLRPSASP
jgi:hypothetical protein